MKRSFSQCYEIIYDFFKKLELPPGLGNSKLGLAKFLGLSQGKTQHWERGQWPHADDLLTIHEKLGFSYRWLVTGEGEPFDEDVPSQSPPPPAPPAPASTSSVPLIGFASCGIEGWHGTMSIPVPVDIPAWHDGMIAVMASGESMLPAGIGHGHICYCDTTKQPGPGEAVFVQLYDGTGALKLFLGRQDKGGGKVFINFQGWLDKKPDSPEQKPFILGISDHAVVKMAPVIYVRRRL